MLKQISQRGYRKSEPYDEDYPFVLPRYLRQAMIMIKKDRQISGNEIMHLSLYTSMVEKILNWEEGFLEEKNSGGEVLLAMK